MSAATLPAIHRMAPSSKKDEGAPCDRQRQARFP